MIFGQSFGHSSFLPGRRQIQGSEDGLFSSSFYLRHHGHSRSAQNGHQHQEPDPAKYELAAMNSASLREKMPTCFWPPVLVFFKADSCLEFKTFVVKDDLYFVKFLISLNS